MSEQKLVVKEMETKHVFNSLSDAIIVVGQPTEKGEDAELSQAQCISDTGSPECYFSNKKSIEIFSVDLADNTEGTRDNINFVLE